MDVLINVMVACGLVASQRLMVLAVPPWLSSPFDLVAYAYVVRERESS